MPPTNTVCKALQGNRQTLKSESAAVGRVRMGIENLPVYMSTKSRLHLAAENWCLIYDAGQCMMSHPGSLAKQPLSHEIRGTSQ